MRILIFRRNKIVLEAIKNGEINVKINKDKQLRHLKENAIINGKSYIDGSLERCQELIDKLYGTGELIYNSKGE